MIRTQQLVLAFLFVLFVFAACKRDPQDQQSTVDFKRTDNTAIIRLGLEPDRLTPLLTVNNSSNQVLGNMFFTLETIDPRTLEYIPLLIKSKPQVREITEGPLAGGLAYTFDLHEEAQWDDGRPVTGHDYVFTLKALLNPQNAASAPYRPYVALIRNVEVDPADPKRFTVFTNEKFILGEEYVTNAFMILPEHLYDPQGLMKDVPLAELADPAKAEALAAANSALKQFADQLNDPKYGRDPQFINGCGPYRLQQWESGQQIVLVRKENWWGDQLADRYPFLQALPDQLVYKPIPDAATSVAALKAEEIDVATEIDPDAFTQLSSDQLTNERYNFHTAPTWACYFIAVNMRHPKLADKRVRRALAHVVNVQELIDNVYNGFGERLATAIPPSWPYVDKSLKPYAFDIERAKQILAEAGWSDTNNNGVVDKEIDGQRTELEIEYLYTAGRETSQAAALLIQDNARRAGISIVPVAQEGAVLLDNLRKRNFQLVSAGRNYGSPLWNPLQGYHTTQGDNRSGFGNAESDALIEQILVTQDQQQRNQLYYRLQGIVYDEVPEIPLFTLQNRLAIHKRFDAEVTALLPNYQPTQLKLQERFRRQTSMK